jgi:hypothetical protein
MRPAPGAETVDRLVRVLGDTARAIRGGVLDDEATDAAIRLLGLEERTAVEHVALLRDPARGLIDDGTVDIASLNTLVELRRRFLPAPEVAGVTGRLHELVRDRVLVG